MNALVKLYDAEEHLWFLNNWMTICRPSSAGRDGVSIMEFHMPYGDSPPTHVHRDEDEIFHLIEGTMRFRVGSDEFALEAGRTIVGPRGVPHTFRVESRNGARGLTITTGPNFERFVRAMGRPAGALAMPAPVEPTPELIAQITRTAARFNVDIIGPPMGA